MDNDQNQNYNDDHGAKPDARTGSGSNDTPQHAPGGGISNRPDDEERENQERLPPRGQEKAGD
jgi:hypothetical protein